MFRISEFQFRQGGLWISEGVSLSFAVWLPDFAKYVPEGWPSHANLSYAPIRLDFRPMIFCSKSGSRDLIFSRFHSILLGRNRWETIISSLSSVGGPQSWSGLERDSHGSFHTLVDLPLPIVFPNLCFRSSFPIIIPLHPWEAEFGVELSRKDEEWQYLSCRILASRHSRLWVFSISLSLGEHHWSIKYMHFLQIVRYYYCIFLKFV